MIIKKFQAYTEKEAIEQARREMGNDAIVMNIKTIKQRGFARLFKKNIIEVTAALEEKEAAPKAAERTEGSEFISDLARFQSKEAPQTDSSIEEKLNSLQKILEQQIIKKDDETPKSAEMIEKKTSENDRFIELIEGKLLENEVDPAYSKEIIDTVRENLKKEASLDTILSGIYQKIILKLGNVNEITIQPEKTKLVFFVGPTGVGKTTTIAKLASYYKLNKQAKVAMITSDTYRIAAVEQLRTYASILNVPLSVVYSMDEFDSAVKEYEGYDIIFVDTAGRSHNNEEQCNEMVHLINDSTVDEDKYDKQVYLVLSVATKYRDLINITDVYERIKPYSLVFTKLDETFAIGNILNIKIKTGASVSYVTSGQVVPDDISVINPQKIAKQLLGGA